MKIQLNLSYLKVLYLMVTLLMLTTGEVHAQSQILWNKPINLSQSTENTSIYPYLLADPAGFVHLFWAEKTSDAAGNRPDTIMYTRWDGTSWSIPKDIFFSPDFLNPYANYPHAVIDNDGYIHLIWIAQPNWPNFALYYATVHSSQVNNLSSWSRPVILAENLTATEFSIDIAFNPPENIHIIFASGLSSEFSSEQRAVTYITSNNGGDIWSNPFDLYASSDPESGASNTRLIAPEPNLLLASWTEWDNSGNGKAIFFTRSTDGGQTWDQVVRLTERIGDEYERDWNNMTILGDGGFLSMWEGGWRAYRQAMYSYDRGETWSEPVDTFPSLIGETGFAQFARDSLERLHIIVINRIREGVSNGWDHSGLWHSEWEGGMRWSDPQPVGPASGMLYPTVVIMEGNKFVVSWASAIDGDIFAMTGLITDAPEIPSQTWPKPTPDSLPETVRTPRTTPTPTDIFQATQVTYNLETSPTSDGVMISPSIGIYAGVLSSVIIIVIIAVIQIRKQR